MEIDLSVYADDMLLWAKGENRAERLEAACLETQRFDNECKLKMNPGKGHVFTTGNDKDDLIRRARFVGPLKMDFVNLGIDYTINRSVWPRITAYQLSQKRTDKAKNR